MAVGSSGEATALARVDRPGAAPLAALGSAAGGRRMMLRDELHEQLLGPPPRFVLISTAGTHGNSQSVIARYVCLMTETRQRQGYITLQA